MSTHAEEIHSHGPGVPTFAKVWVALLVMTGVEVLLAYMQTPMMIMLTENPAAPAEEQKA